MVSDKSVEIFSINQEARHYSYDLVQKLTFFVISIELIFCGYMLLNADRFGSIKYSSYLFLLSGSAAIFGIFWRFCYNQTNHEESHQTHNCLLKFRSWAIML